MLLLLLACASPGGDVLPAETGLPPAACADCVTPARTDAPPSSSSPIPIAVAECTTPPEERTVCTAIDLDGTASRSRAPGPLTFDWEVLSGPSAGAVAAAVVEEATDASPALYVRQPGPYRLLLTVRDRSGATSRPDALDLVVAERTSNDPPVADAGADQEDSVEVTCTPTAYGTGYACGDCSGGTFTLDASGTTDADGEPLTYRWDVVSGGGTVLPRNGVSATFRLPPMAATFGATTTTTATVRLRVTDCGGATSVDTVEITRSCTGV